MVTNPLSVLIALIQYSTYCYLILNVSLQMHHTNHMTICSDNHFPFGLLFADGSQLLTLQHGLRRGAGEQDGAGLQRGEDRLDVKPLACQSCIAAACARSFLHLCRDALMPLCWRCSRQLVLLHRAVSWKCGPLLDKVDSYTAIHSIYHRYQACRCRLQFQPHFLLTPCTSQHHLLLSAE